MSDDTICSSEYTSRPSESGPDSDAARNASLTSATVTSRPSTAVKSVMDPSATGTRNACPSRRPFIASSTRLVARAAPVLDGMMFSAAARASRRSLDGPSTSACAPV